MSTNSTELSFVELEVTGDGEQRITNYWRPVRCGSYREQCQEGRRRAAEAVAFVRETGKLPLLTWIVGAMPRGRDMGGVEVGFLTGLGEVVA